MTATAPRANSKIWSILSPNAAPMRLMLLAADRVADAVLSTAYIRILVSSSPIYSLHATFLQRAGFHERMARSRLHPHFPDFITYAHPRNLYSRTQSSE